MFTRFTLIQVTSQNDKFTNLKKNSFITAFWAENDTI